MLNRMLIARIIILLIIILTEPLLGQPVIEKKDTDLFNITFQDLKTDSLRILQVTDLHLGIKDKWNDDLNSLKRIKKLHEMYKPDLIFITGDLLTGAKYFGSLLAGFIVHFFDNLNIPWLYVFGNHDPEGGFGRDEIFGIFDRSEWGVIGYHDSGGNKKYDYIVNLFTDKMENPSWQIFAFDTGPHDGVKAIQPDQISWFRRQSNESHDLYNKIIPALSIFHIPLIQYQELWDDKNIQKKGVSLEKVYYEEDDGSLYKAFVDIGNVSATFCGHDHYNNYWGKTKDGIILSYGYISGEATKEAWPTGGKLISIPLKEGEIFIKNVIPVFDSTAHKY